jgi:hypothetical protein
LQHYIRKSRIIDDGRAEDEFFSGAVAA